MKVKAHLENLTGRNTKELPRNKSSSRTMASSRPTELNSDRLKSIRMSFASLELSAKIFLIKLVVMKSMKHAV
jgi:hypothetical protein